MGEDFFELFDVHVQFHEFFLVDRRISAELTRQIAGIGYVKAAAQRRIADARGKATGEIMR